MFAMLGDVRFELLSGFTAFDETHTASYAKHDVLAGRPRLQAMGNDDVLARCAHHRGDAQEFVHAGGERFGFARAHVAGSGRDDQPVAGSQDRIEKHLPVVDARAGEFELRASAAETALWPTGLLTVDIKYTENHSGHVAASETFSLCVFPSETP